MLGRSLDSPVKLCWQAAILICTSLVPLSGQVSKTCPDWSSKFNQIQEAAMLQTLQSERAAGWSQLNASLSNPSATFAQGNQLIAMAQSRIQSDQIGLQQIAVGRPGPVSDSICKANRGSAVLALQCDIMDSQDLILATQGTLELLQCRTGFAGAINSGAGGTPRAGSSKATTSDLLNSLFGPKLATPLASQSNLQDFENNKADSPVVGDAAGSEQADASSIASQVASTDKPTDSLNSEVDAALAGPNSAAGSNGADGIQTSAPPNGANIQASNDADWKDPQASASQETEHPQTNPLATDSPNDSTGALNPAQENVTGSVGGTVDNSQSLSGNDLANRNQELTADLLKSGVASTGEVGETAVQAFDNTQGWLKLSSSDPNDQIDGVTQIVNGANQAFNGNDASKVVTDQMIGVVGSVGKQEFNTLDTLNRAIGGGDVSPSDINSQIDAFPQAFARGLIPGYNTAETIQLDIQNAQTNITKRFNSGMQSIQNFLTGKTPCSVFVDPCQ